jgi:hypothetical protein
VSDDAHCLNLIFFLFFVRMMARNCLSVRLIGYLIIFFGINMEVDDEQTDGHGDG